MSEADVRVLGLDWEFVRLCSVGFANRAERLTRDDARADNLAVARMFTAAASCWSLVDALPARENFRRATSNYYEARQPYANITATCAVDDDRYPIYWPPEWAEERRVLEPWLWTMLATIRSGLVGLDGLRSVADQLNGRASSLEGSALAMTAVGRLAIPLDVYLRFLRAVTNAVIQDEPDALADATFAYFNRVDDRVRMAMMDRYHRRQILTTLLPVEPEALAVAIVALMAARRTGAMSFAQLPVGPGFVALSVARAILEFR